MSKHKSFRKTAVMQWQRNENVTQIEENNIWQEMLPLHLSLIVSS